LFHIRAQTLGDRVELVQGAGAHDDTLTVAHQMPGHQRANSFARTGDQSDTILIIWHGLKLLGLTLVRKGAPQDSFRPSGSPILINIGGTGELELIQLTGH
jgi:hypothetical protein